jgi:hypothetical protein
MFHYLYLGGAVLLLDENLNRFFRAVGRLPTHSRQSDGRARRELIETRPKNCNNLPARGAGRIQATKSGSLAPILRPGWMTKV